MIFVRRICAAMIAAGFFAAATQAAETCGDGSATIPLSQRYTRGLLFKVEKCGLPVSYVFGTVHLADNAIARTAGAAFLTLSDVQAAGFELAEPQEEIVSSGRKSMIYAPGEKHSLIRQIGPERYHTLMNLLRPTKLSEKAVNNLRPWAISVLLELLGEKPGTPLDEKLHAVATSLKKPVFGLETLQEQMHLFTDMPQSLQTAMLIQAIDEHGKVEDLKHQMVKAYIEHDLNKIETLEEESVTGSEDRKLDDYMLDHIINARNRIMEQRLLPYLRKESVLVAVGAMHLMGDQGILHLLEQDGYSITPLP